MSTEKATAKCDMCAPYDRPGYVLNAGQWVKCWQCAQPGVTLRETCECGKSHTRADSFKPGDRVRVRVHWRHYHRTGTVSTARDGFGAERVYDVDLDANDGGPAALRAMGAWELWAEAVRS